MNTENNGWNTANIMDVTSYILAKIVQIGLIGLALYYLWVVF